MSVFKLILFFLSFIIPGYLIVDILLRQRFSTSLKLVFAYGLGLYLITMQIFVWLFLFKAGFNANFFSLVLLFEILILFSIWLRKSKKHDVNYTSTEGERLSDSKFKMLRIVLFFFVIFQIFSLGINILSRPTATYDNLAAWSYKSKVLFENQKINFISSEPDFLGGGGHSNYPWLIPLAQFWFYNVFGEYNDLLVNFIFFGFFLSLIVLVYGHIKMRSGAVAAIIFTFLLSSAPLLFYHAYNGYADLALGFYLCLSYYFFSQALRKDKKYFILSAIFLGISFFVKNDALIFLIAIGATGIIYNLKNLKNNIAQMVQIFLISLVTIFPWFIYMAINGLSFENTESGWGLHPEIIHSFVSALFLSGSWNIWWFVFFAILVLKLRQWIDQKEERVGPILVLTTLFGFLCLYLFTKDYIFAINGTALSRNILGIFPVSVLVIGEVAGLRNNKIK